MTHQRRMDSVVAVSGVQDLGSAATTEKSSEAKQQPPS